MGCDIHGYIEFRDPTAREPRWTSFGGKLWLDRNYNMFGILAGVRVPEEQLYEARGIPSDLGWMAEDDYTLYVDDRCAGETKFCTRLDAEGWVRSGSSRWTNDKRNEVTHPDWHTPSWLTTAEYGEALRHYNERREQWETDAEIEVARIRREQPQFAPFYEIHKPGEAWRLGVSYTAILGAMVAAEEHGCQARLVFWFDN